MSLEIEIASKRSEGGGPAAVAELSLTVEDGEACAVVGAAGTGKSALLSMIAGLGREAAGDVRGRRTPIGVLFQTPRLLPWRTAGENLALVLRGREARISTWLAAVGLEGQERVYADRLSPDMAKRLAIARALAVEPAVLLLDEPFDGLEPSSAVRMRDLLADYLRAARPTTLLLSRTAAEVASLADRIVIIAGSPPRVVRDSRLGGPSDEPRDPPAYRRPSIVLGGGGRAS